MNIRDLLREETVHDPAGEHVRNMHRGFLLVVVSLVLALIVGGLLAVAIIRAKVPPAPEPTPSWTSVQLPTL